MGLTAGDGLQVDHGDRDTLNNQRANLSIVNNEQNHWNLGIRRNNTSGCSGVWRNSKTGKWVAEIMRRGKKRSLGSYVQFEEAVAARKAAETFPN